MRRRRAGRGTRSGISAIGGFRMRSGKPKHGLPYHVKEWLRFSRRVRVSRPFPVAGDFRASRVLQSGRAAPAAWRPGDKAAFRGGVSCRSYRRLSRSEEPTSEIQSLMRISYAVLRLKTK